jgi:hypothetical protein
MFVAQSLRKNSHISGGKSVVSCVVRADVVSSVRISSYLIDNLAHRQELKSGGRSSQKCSGVSGSLRVIRSCLAPWNGT